MKIELKKVLVPLTLTMGLCITITANAEGLLITDPAPDKGDCINLQGARGTGKACAGDKGLELNILTKATTTDKCDLICRGNKFIANMFSKVLP